MGNPLVLVLAAVVAYLVLKPGTAQASSGSGTPTPAPPSQPPQQSVADRDTFADVLAGINVLFSGAAKIVGAATNNQQDPK